MAILDLEVPHKNDGDLFTAPEANVIVGKINQIIAAVNTGGGGGGGTGYPAWANTTPRGGTADRPASPTNEAFWYNTDTDSWEFTPDNGATWLQLRTTTGGGGGAGIASSIFPTYITNSGRSSEAGEINDLAAALDSAGISDYIVGMWLMNGGTAAKNKLNMFDPADDDSAFRLLFNSVTHAAKGISTANDTGYIDTLITLLNISPSYPHIGFHAYVQSAAANQALIQSDGANNYFFPFETGVNKSYVAISGGISGATVTGGNKAGWIGGQRLDVSGTDKAQTWFRGVKVAEETTAGATTTSNTCKMKGSSGLGIPVTSVLCVYKAMPESMQITFGTIMQDFAISMGFDV